MGRFPFDPTRVPFFYGWSVLACGTLGMLMTAPGQTVGVSVFTDFLIEAQGLSRSVLSLSYLAGTIGSALLLSVAGQLYDRFGGRWVAVGAALSLALVLLGLTYSPSATEALAGLFPERFRTAVAFCVMAVGFFLLRFCGQGVMALASRNMVMEWFEKRRGMANAVLGTSIAFGFSVVPRGLEELIQAGGWRWAWQVLAVALAGFALFAFITYRARPEDHGMSPDGNLPPPKKAAHAEAEPGVSFTLPEARRTYSFWVFSLTLFLSGLLLTAYTFHIVSIFDDAGMARSRAVLIFIPAAIVSVSFEFIGSLLSDYIKLKWLAMVQLAGIVVLATGLVVLQEGVPVVLAIIGHGMMQGMFGITSGVTWPRFFGRTHLGAISGFALALTVAGTAVGPYVFSFSRDLSGSYVPAALGCGIVGLVLFLAAFRAERPRASSG
jgi:sugar phosphate permease